MKVKNIMFSGVMAAILGATGANAAVTVASQGYVDSKVGAVETNIANTYLTQEAADATYLTETQVTEQITNVIAAEDGAVATAQAAADKAQDEVDALETVVAGKADSATTLEGYGITDAYTKTEVDQKVADVVAGDMSEALKAYVTSETYTAGLALKADKTQVATDIANAVADKADTANVYSKTDADSTFATKTALGDVDAKFADYTKTSDLNSTFATDAELKAVDDKFANYKTTTELETEFAKYAEKTALESEEAARIAADKVATDALANVYTKEQADAAFDKEGSAAAVEAKLKLLATADVPEECQSDSSMCVLSMTSSGTFAWTPLTAPLDSTASN